LKVLLFFLLLTCNKPECVYVQVYYKYFYQYSQVYPTLNWKAISLKYVQAWIQILAAN